MALTKLPGFTLDTSSNVRFANADVTGNLTAGNANLGNAVTANFFIGNGSQLTGVIAAAGTSLINGNSNVVVEANSNVTISAVGNANIVTITGTGVNVAGTLNVSGNTILGNLTVTGTTTTVNSTTTQVSDPLFEIGGGENGAALTVNDNMDRGQLLHYYNAGAIDAFIGWKNANSEFIVASNVSISSNNIVTVNSLANLRANFFIGDGSRLSNVTPIQLVNGNSNIVVGANGPIVMSAVGSYSAFTVGQLGSNVSGTLGVSGNLTSGNANLGNLATANFIQGVIVGASANQSNITTLGQLTNLSVLGNANISGYANIVGNITSANANLGNSVNANFFIGNGSLLTGIGGAGYIFNGTSNANIGTTNGNFVVSINGTAAVTTFSNVGVNVTGYITASGNITGGNANLGNNVSANFFTGNGSLLTGIGGAGYIFNGTSNANIATSGGNLSIGIGGTANVGIFTSTGVNVTGYLTATGNVTAGNVYSNTGTIGASLLTGTLTTAAQPNITSIGTLSLLNVTGQANVGNLVTPTTVNAVGNITGGNFTTGGALSVTGNANVGNIGANIGIFTGNITGANANLGNSVIANFFTGNFYGPANTASTVTTASQPNITSIGTLTGLTVTGNVALSGANVSLGSSGNVKITGGSTNQYLKTDGTGNLSWGTPSGGGGGGTALTYTAAATPPGSANIADQWYNTSTSTLYEYVNDGTSSFWLDIQTPTVSSATPASILIQNQGSNLTFTPNTINFTGAGVTATNSGNTVTVSVVATESISPFLLMGA